MDSRSQRAFCLFKPGVRGEVHSLFIFFLKKGGFLHFLAKYSQRRFLVSLFLLAYLSLHPRPRPIWRYFSKNPDFGPFSPGLGVHAVFQKNGKNRKVALWRGIWASILAPTARATCFCTYRLTLRSLLMLIMHG